MVQVERNRRDITTIRFCQNVKKHDEMFIPKRNDLFFKGILYGWWILFLWLYCLKNKFVKTLSRFFYCVLVQRKSEVIINKGMNMIGVNFRTFRPQHTIGKLIRTRSDFFLFASILI